MYNFIDTNEVSESNLLPSEALQINGEYIENLIPGYRTLYVKGREALSPNLDTYDVGSRDGVQLKNKRFPARYITVGYQLVTSSNEAFRDAYNQLGSILNKEDSILIFNDETDKFFRGTLDSMGEVEPGRNSVTGEFDLVCLEPFKYSVVEYEAVSTSEDNSILIDYEGSYKAHPTLEAEFYSESEFDESGSSTTLSGKGDCGYIAFFNENEKIIQLGDPDELDVEEAYEKSQTLINQSFETSGAWGTNQSSTWSKNSGKAINNASQVGSMGIGIAQYAVASTPKDTSATLGKYSNLAARPYTYYTVSCKATNRTANSVKLTFSITGSLEATGYVYSGYGLKTAIYIGGAWREVTLKGLKDRWNGSTGHTVNVTYTLTGLSKTDASISGIKFRVTRIDSLDATWGVITTKTLSAMPISQYVDNVPEKYYLNASSFGSGSSWHGPSITRTIPNDASGASGASNFTFSFRQKFDSTNTNQIGAFQALVLDSSNKCIAGIRISKCNAGTSATLSLLINDKQVYYQDVNVASGASAVNMASITKSYTSIRFDCAGISKTFTKSEIGSMTAVKIMFMFEQYASKDTLGHNGLYYAKFIKNHCDVYRNIPNKFSANDVVSANCENGEIKLNGILTPSLGALANNWEGFVLEPGLNQIGFSYSDWVEDAYKPKVKVKYREVFL